MPETIYEDKTILCIDCKQNFEFSAGEQKFFFEREFSTPKRCKPCKNKKRSEDFSGNNNRIY